MIFQNFPKHHEPRSGEWYLENFEISRAGIIAKYYAQVMLLFVYNRSREIFGNAQETFLVTVEKNKHSRLRNLVPRVLSLLRESTLVAAGHVSARFLQIPEK